MAADFPSRIDIVPWGAWEHSAVVTPTRSAVSTVLDLGWCQTLVQNAEVGWKVALKAGTWSLTMTSYYDSSRGIASFYLAGTAIGTIDCYLAANNHNAVGTIAGFTVATSGVYLLKYVAATKNAASSNYYLTPHHITLQRTGA